MLGVVPCTPNIKSALNVTAGFYKRPAMSHTFVQATRDRFAAFVRDVYIPGHVNLYKRPFKMLTDDEAIDRLDVPENTKKQMKQKLEQMRGRGYRLNKKMRTISLFIKLEFYIEELKFPRLIMPLEMEARVAGCAPVAALNEAIYDFPSCIKKTPFLDRSELIRKMFTGPVVANDCSSFESSCDRWIIENIIEPIYLALAENSADERVARFLKERKKPMVMQGMGLKFTTEPVLNSGSVDTSLSNFVLNDAGLAFAADEAGVDNVRLVEGDDAISTPIPRLTETFSELGFTLKTDYYDDVSDASFCRCYSGGKANLTDAIYALAKLGWTDGKYLGAKKKKKLALLKAKCMSYLIQYAGCPIIGPIADAILNILEDIDEIRPDDWWERNKFQFWKPELRGVPVLEKDREEYNRLFEVTIEEQKCIEREVLSSLEQGIGEYINSPQFFRVAERKFPHWIINWEKDVRHVPTSGKIFSREYMSEGPNDDNIWEQIVTANY